MFKRNNHYLKSHKTTKTKATNFKKVAFMVAKKNIIISRFKRYKATKQLSNYITIYNSRKYIT